jgi:hypothetical protein
MITSARVLRAHCPPAGRNAKGTADSSAVPFFSKRGVLPSFDCRRTYMLGIVPV